MKKDLILGFTVLLMFSFALVANGASEGGAAVEVRMNPAGVLPIVDEPLQLTVMTAQDPLVIDFDENSQTKWIEEQTNIDIVWQLVPSQQATEKINLLLAAATDLPDVLLHDMENDTILKYGKEELLIDLAPLIATYGHEIKTPIADFAERGADMLGMYRSPDGGIYALPVLNSCEWCESFHRMWFNTEWMETLGLDYPDTTDEFYDVLTAFKTEDPNGNGIADEIPLMGAKQGWGAAVEGFLMMPFLVYDIAGGNRLYLEEGKVEAAYTKEQWLQGVTWIRKLVADDLLDPVSLTQQQQEFQIMGEKEPAVTGAFIAGHPGVFLTMRDQKWRGFEAVSPLQGVSSGKKQTFKNIYQPFGRGRFAITADCEYPEVAFRWLDFQYSPKNSIWSRYGEEGIDWIPADPGQLGPFGAPARFQEIGNWGGPTDRSLRQKMMYLSSDVLAGLGMVTTEDGEPDNLDTQYIFATAKYRDYAVGNGVPRVFMNPEEVNEYSELENVLKTYVNETFARFVTGDLPLTEWDNFQAELKKIGIHRYLEMTQAAYDRQFK